jgi:5-methylcytosine-specific restriction endonuclease McrBC regulatory subunit McrC
MKDINHTAQNRLPLLRDNRFNDQGADISDISSHVKSVLSRYDGMTLAQWAKLGVKIFPALPQCGEARDDESHKLNFFTLGFDNRENPTRTWINTHNCMGVVRLQDEGKSGAVQIEIGSRFDKDEKQFFLTYLLSQVFGGSIVDLVNLDNKSLWDMLLAFLFRRWLLEAGAVGLFKQYQSFSRNDTRVRGRIDVDRHLRRNIPFCGNVAYTSHEITFDNPTNHLIRHALARVAGKWGAFLTRDSRLNEIRHQLEQNTPTWRPGDVIDCIRRRENRAPIKHPYFHAAYEPLRQISLSLLRNEGASLYQQHQEAEGVIFDGSWLWEEYLWTLLKRLPGFEHSENKKRRGGWNTGLTVTLFPDFFHKAKRVVLDAKYQRQFDKQDEDTKREIVKQIFTYMFLLDAVGGGLINPEGDEEKIPIPIHRQIEDAQHLEKQAYWHCFVLKPPSDACTAEDFVKKMREKEERFTNVVKKRVLG